MQAAVLSAAVLQAAVLQVAVLQATALQAAALRAAEAGLVVGVLGASVARLEPAGRRLGAPA